MRLLIALRDLLLITTICSVRFDLPIKGQALVNVSMVQTTGVSNMNELDQKGKQSIRIYSWEDDVELYCYCLIRNDVIAQHAATNADMAFCVCVKAATAYNNTMNQLIHVQLSMKSSIKNEISFFWQVHWSRSISRTPKLLLLEIYAFRFGIDKINDPNFDCDRRQYNVGQKTPPRGGIAATTHPFAQFSGSILITLS